MGSFKRISPLINLVLSSNSFNASINESKCPMAASACAERAIEIGAPISCRIACAKSSNLFSVTNFSSFKRARRSFFVVFE